MPPRILFVDDDANVLSGYQRALRGEFDIESAQGAHQALQALVDCPGYAVVISDMRMPVMNGIQFLMRVKERAPDAVRIMLTGNADMQTAIDAVNEGCVFQFLTKPCPPARLSKVLAAGVAQHELICSERDLLEKTLRGAVKVLTETLCVLNPLAFSRSERVTDIVRALLERKPVRDAWKFELAAMLSQLGCLTLPSETLEAMYAGLPLPDEDRERVEAHPLLARDLIANIPRLEDVALMIARQREPYNRAETHDEHEPGPVALGARMLRLAIDFDVLRETGLSHQQAIDTLRSTRDVYDPALVSLLEGLGSAGATVRTRRVLVSSLEVGMVLQEDLRSSRGLMLVTRGQEITIALMQRLRNFVRIGALDGEVTIREPERRD